MAKSKQAKVKTSPTLTKDMKASIEKMVSKVQDWAYKKFTAIEKQLDKLKNTPAKIASKSGKKTKPTSAKKKKGRTSKKKGNSANQQAEAA